MAGSSNVIQIIFLLTNKFFENAAIETFSNNNQVLSDTNDINEQNITCRAVRSFCWYLSENYDKKLEPWEHPDAKNKSLPYYYDFDFPVNGIQEVDDFKHTIKLEMYFIIKWWEPRMKIKPILNATENEKNAPEIFYAIPLDNLELLWTPDVEIYSMNMYQSPKVLRKEMASLKVNKDSILRYSNYATLTLSCKLHFDDYPFDSHHCIFRAGSYTYWDEIVECTSKLVKWNTSEQQSFQYEATLEDMSQEHHTWYTPEHGWATCGFEITLKRPKTQIIIEVYLTATSLVIISWLSFVVNPSVIPGRMGMLVTVFLVLINIFIGVKTNSPTSNGLNAADIFLVTCIGQVFLALVEYAMVLVVYAQPGRERPLSSKASTEVFVEDLSEKIPQWAVKYQNALMQIVQTKQTIAPNIQWNLIDKIALFLFPFTFIIFLISYFNKYM